MFFESLLLPRAAAERSLRVDPPQREENE